MFFRKVLYTLLMLTSTAAIAGNQYQIFNPNLHEKIDGKYAMKNQLLVAVHPGVDLTGIMNQVAKRKGLKIKKSEVISSKSTKINIIKINLEAAQTLTSAREILRKIPNVEWVQPNYIYNINVDPREEIPNDPRINEQYHHQLMANMQAWDISKGDDVLIAITDDGFDINHEDLVTRMNVQKGYNFCDDNTDVTSGASGDSHGTHVSGIAAAEMNNGKGGVGVAAHATILPVKFYGSSCNWTSDLIYKSYQYSADSGAKIISTSYNVDEFAGDKTFIAALDYAYDKGVLHFNSAGNNNRKDPPRAAFEELILVASTNDHDLKSSYSNYGRKIHISAPGEKILSTVPTNRYTLMSGTSMAAPNAAGSAALIWAAHPAWNRDQVAAQLVGTADNIDDKNPKYVGLLGSGRVNNYRALTEQLVPTKVMDVKVTSSATKESSEIAVRFDKLLNPDVVNNGEHWEIISLADSSIIPATVKHRWFIGSRVLELSTPKLKPGKYQLTVKDSLQDPFGQALDGKATGTAGGNYVEVFEIV